MIAYWKRRRPVGRNGMKNKKTIRSRGRDERKTVRYTDEYIEDYIDDDDRMEQEGADQGSDDDEDEYIVAYSSEDAVFGDYTPEQMKEYAEEYEEQQEEYGEAGEYDDQQNYEGSGEYDEIEEYGEPEEYGDQQEYEEPEEYDEAEGYDDQQEYGYTEEYDEIEEYDGLEEYDEIEGYEEPEEYNEIEEYEEPEGYDGQQEYDEAEEYDEQQEYDEAEGYDEQQEYGYTEEYDEIEEYEEPEEYDDQQEYEEYEESADEEFLYRTMEINVDAYVPDDYAEDTGSYYENVEEGAYGENEEEYYASDEYYDDEYDNAYLIDEYGDDEYVNEIYLDEGSVNEEYDEDFFDIAYGDFDMDYEDDTEMYGIEDVEEPSGFWQKVKMRLGNLTVFDAVLVSTGVVVMVAACVILSMFVQSRQIGEQIEALAPLGTELKEMGIVGSDGLFAMADAALSGNFAETEEPGSENDQPLDVVDTPVPVGVNVNFESVERDLKIRFTDVNTGELITGTVFEVTLTNAKGKQLVLTDDDMDGIIYAKNVNAGVFEAVVTSTDKYKFPTVAQQVTVKDKVEYVVINVQDEVKTEKQINVAAEDTEKNVAAAEAEILKDTVEWVESTKTPVSGSESYLLVDKNTIADPSQVSMAAARMLFDTLNVTLEPSNATLGIGSSIDLKGKEFSNLTDGDIEYQYTAEWKSSDEKIATVSGGKVTAKAAGEAVITYTVTRKTITTTYETKTPIEVTEELEITQDQFEKELSEEEKANCTPIDAEDLTRGYLWKKVTKQEQEPEKKTSETTESASAECKITVEPAKITSGSLELAKSQDSCQVGATLTVKPAKLVYTKNDNSTETITENFPAVTWESSDKAIATVAADGVVTGVKAGKVHITGKITGIKGADGNELNISASVEISVTESPELMILLDKTSDVNITVGSTATLVATVSNYKSDAGVTWESSDKKIATVDEKGVVTGVAVGSATITATTKEKDKDGKQKQATCTVTVKSNAASDTTTKLKDKNGNQIYVKNSDGSYREAVYADYFDHSEFYITAQANYVYTGWQTIEGKTYFYDKNGKAVTGTQIIQGVTYNFGTDGAIATTVGNSTFGIDVSRHNGTIDWNAVKASGVDYVIIRCGYRGSSTGALIEDQNFRANIKGATAAGLKVGVYVFSQAVDEVEAVKEASLAVSLVKGYNLTYPIFIDTEESGGRADKIDRATRTAVVNAFCQTVASAGYQPGIYASKTWFEDKLNMGGVGNCRIWLAQYSAAPSYKGKYDLWQYSSKGTISGISTDVDLNYSYTGY